MICSTIVSKCGNNTNNKNNKNNMNIKNNKNKKHNNDPGNSSNLVGSGQVESWSGGVASDQSGHVTCGRSNCSFKFAQSQQPLLGVAPHKSNCSCPLLAGEPANIS